MIFFIFIIFYIAYVFVVGTGVFIYYCARLGEVIWDVLRGNR